MVDITQNDRQTLIQRQTIMEALENGDECAIETIFEMFPLLTRDEAVDLLEVVIATEIPLYD